MLTTVLVAPVTRTIRHIPTEVVLDDVEEPVTKELLRAELGELRTELRSGLARGEVGLAELRTEVRSGLARGEVGMAELRTEMHKLANRSLITLVGVALTAVGVAISLVR